MRIEDINKNTNMIKMWFDNAREAAEQYYDENPDSLIPLFEEELRDLGFSFVSSNQSIGFMPKHKKMILPIAIRYYQLAKEQQKDNEQNHFMSFFRFKGMEEVIPILLEDYYSKETKNQTRWFISDCLYQIRSRSYIKEYMEIIANPAFGINRQMIILLVGKLKIDNAISILVNLLEDEEVRLHVISALGEFKREDLRDYFERFQDSTHSGWRKYAKIALKKLDAAGGAPVHDLK